MAENESIQNLVNLVRSFEDAKSTSLPKYTQKSRIDSAVFIQKEISDLPVIGDIMKTFLDTYVGYILTAMDLRTYITGTTTIRDYIETVATEELKYIDQNNIGKDLVASFVSDFKKGYEDLSDIPRYGNLNENRDMNTGRVTPIEFKQDKPFPNGRLLNIAVQSPHNPDVKFNVTLNVQLSPRIIQDAVAEQFISLNIDRDIYKRWLMYRAKEISFFRDFIGEADKRKARRKALKQDRTGDLQAMLADSKNAVAQHWLKLLRIKPNKQNIANSISIYDRATFDRVTNNAGFNFDRAKDRTAYFEKSYGMVVATVDQRHNLIHMYYNGIDKVSVYNFNQVMSSAKKDTLNLMAVMSQMADNKPVTF